MISNECNIILAHVCYNFLDFHYPVRTRFRMCLGFVYLYHFVGTNVPKYSFRRFCTMHLLYAVHNTCSAESTDLSAGTIIRRVGSHFLT